MDSLSQHQASGAAQVHDRISSTASKIATEKSKFSGDIFLNSFISIEASTIVIRYCMFSHEMKLWISLVILGFLEALIVI